MKPWRKQFGIWVPDRSLSDDRGFINAGAIGAIAGSRRRTSASYDPATDSSVVYWYKADGTLYTTDSGSTPCANGNDIGKWVEAKTGGSGFDAIQATAIDRPQFRSTGGPSSMPCVDFTSSTSRKLRAQWASAAAQPYTVWAVAKLSENNKYSFICDGFGATNRAAVYHINTGDWRTFTTGDSNGVSSSTSWVIVRGIFNGSSSTIALNNGSATAQASTGTGSFGGITLGNHYTLSSAGYLKLAEVLVQNAAADSTAISNMLGYLNAKYAIY